MTLDPTTRPTRTSSGVPRSLQVGALLVVITAVLLTPGRACGLGMHGFGRSPRWSGGT